VQRIQETWISSGTKQAVLVNALHLVTPLARQIQEM
jgi:hypothetical protein